MPEREPSEEQLGETLNKRMPGPSPRFEAILRARLMELDARARRPKALWLLVAVYLMSGVALLLIGALGA